MHEYIILVFDVQMLFHLFVCTSVKVVYKMVSEVQNKFHIVTVDQTNCIKPSSKTINVYSGQKRVFKYFSGPWLFCLFVLKI